jgi:nicotinamide mononucleotide transporter
VNAVAIAAYWKAELAFTAFLYAVYFFLAVAGWRAWRVSLLKQAAEANA